MRFKLNTQNFWIIFGLSKNNVKKLDIRETVDRHDITIINFKITDMFLYSKLSAGSVAFDCGSGKPVIVPGATTRSRPPWGGGRHLIVPGSTTRNHRPWGGGRPLTTYRRPPWADPFPEKDKEEPCTGRLGK